MIHSLIDILLRRRHFWRHVDFSEVAELYASRALRMLALNLISVFIAIFLYQNGFSVAGIAIYFTCFFVFKMFVVVPSALFIARFGPKHATLLSNLLYIPALVLFLFVPDIGLPALIGFGFLQGISATMYDLAYLIGFSKVGHPDHAGKEIGYMNIVEKVATGISPLIGGFMAFLFGPEATILLASVLFALAAVPLLRTAEPVLTHQKLTFKGFPFKKVLMNNVAEAGTGYDALISGTLWSLFIVTVILSSSSNEVYAQVGIFSSITLLTSLVISYVYGKIIDKNRGGSLLRYAVVLDALTHLGRPFVGSPAGVITANISNEIATTGYVMPFLRGKFDAVERLPGFRIAYMTIQAIWGNGGAALACFVLAVGAVLWGGETGLRVLFLSGSVVVLLIACHRFPLYRRS